MRESVGIVCGIDADGWLEGPWHAAITRSTTPLNAYLPRGCAHLSPDVPTVRPKRLCRVRSNEMSTREPLAYHAQLAPQRRAST